MKANELTNGNLVGSIVIEYLVWKIDGLGNIQGINDGTTFNLDKTTYPIKITEENFNKFKEVIKASGKTYFIPMPKIKAEIHLVWFMKSWVVELYNGYSNLPIVLDTEFIHQLQNLYFALTGAELTLKPE